MKRFFLPLATITLLALTFSTGSLRAQDPGPGTDDQGMAPPPGPGDPNDPGDDQGGASFQTFYDNLSSQGSWIQTDQYGYVFQPNVSDPQWQPYTDGRWVYTDQGWTWVSDEPWGWATYHYGRWADLDNVGWVWVPGYQWAPAWVSWRYGGGYAGWAPLPPDAYYGGGGGYHFGGDVDIQFHIGFDRYHFLREGDLGNRDYRGRFVDRSNNVNIYNRTTNITNINVTNNHYGNNGGVGGGRGRGAFGGVNAGGPPIAQVNARSSHKVPTVQLTQAGGAGRSTLHGNSLAIFAPRVHATTGSQARPATVARNLGHATVRTSGSPEVNHATAGFQNSGVQHPAGNDHPEPATAPVYHPTSQGQSEFHQPEANSEGTYHPQTQVHTETSLEGTYHPQAQVHTEASSQGTYHPQAQVHTESNASAYHPENQYHAPSSQHIESHSAPQGQHAGPAADHSHSAAAKSSGDKKDDKKH